MMNDLIAHGADINAQGEQGWTALQVAAYNNDIEVAEFLLTQPELDVNIRNDVNTTALSIVASVGHNEILELMLAHTGLNLEDADEKFGFTALHRALFFGYDETAKLLVRHGADVTAKTNDGRIPMDLAKGKVIMKWLNSWIKKERVL